MRQLPMRHWLWLCFSLPFTFVWIGFGIYILNNSIDISLSEWLLVLLLYYSISYYSSFKVAQGIVRYLDLLSQRLKSFAQSNFTAKFRSYPIEELQAFDNSLLSSTSNIRNQLTLLEQQHHESEVLLSSMTEGVIALDASQHILKINIAALNLFNLSTEARGKTLGQVIRHPEVLEFVDKSLQSHQTQEREIQFHDFENLYLQMHAAPLKDEQRKILGLVIVFNNVTQIKQLELVRKEFVANVSHELKTPITLIKGWVETLQDGALHDSAEAERFLNIIAKHTDRLYVIIEDLLKLSRIEQVTDRDEIKKQSLALLPILQTAVENCQDSAEPKQIQVDLLCKNNPQLMVNAALLEQAVINLIMNAIQHSPIQSHIEISCELGQKDVVIAVRDWGVGIAREHLGRIFERFYRVDASRSRHQGGSGLGLAIVKHIAQAHHGTVSVESTPFEGSTFKLHFPLSKNDAPLINS